MKFLPSSDSEQSLKIRNQKKNQSIDSLNKAVHMDW